MKLLIPINTFNKSSVNFKQQEMKPRYVLITSLCLALASCSENKGKNSGPDNINLESTITNAENRGKADQNASGGNKCLLDYQSKYDQLLSEQDVLTATGFSKAIMTTKSSTVLKNPEYHSFEYRFKNGRVSESGITKGIAMPDVIAVSSIKTISLSAFENTYKSIADEEIQVAKNALTDATEGKSGNAEADAAVKKAEELKVNKEQVKETGGKILDVIKDVSKGYQVVENLGDAARWNIVTNELIVLQNGVQFKLDAKLSNDNEKNKSVAIALAKTILNKCR